MTSRPDIQRYAFEDFDKWCEMMREIDISFDSVDICVQADMYANDDEWHVARDDQ